jgi:hypothetical protein
MDMIKVNVSVSSLSVERFWDNRKPAPNIQIATNINVVSIDKKAEDSLEVPFVLTINYNPSVAQMNLKGSAYVQGDKGEIEKILKDYEQKKSPAQIILQSISNVVFTESILVSRVIGIPPPIPLPLIPEPGTQAETKHAGRDYSR